MANLAVHLHRTLNSLMSQRCGAVMRTWPRAPARHRPLLTSLGKQDIELYYIVAMLPVAPTCLSFPGDVPCDAIEALLFWLLARLIDPLLHHGAALYFCTGSWFHNMVLTQARTSRNVFGESDRMMVSPSTGLGCIRFEISFVATAENNFYNRGLADV